MPTRTVQRFIRVPIEEIYSRVLANAPGWGGGSAEDVASVEWDPQLRTLTIERVVEGNRAIGLIRGFTATAIEIASLLSTLPQSPITTATDIETIEYESASRQVLVYKVPEPG